MRSRGVKGSQGESMGVKGSQGESRRVKGSQEESGGLNRSPWGLGDYMGGHWRQTELSVCMSVCMSVSE